MASLAVLFCYVHYPFFLDFAEVVDIAFALFAGAAIGQGTAAARALLAVAGVASLAFVGWNIAVYFTFWLIGVAVSLLPRTPLLTRWRHLPALTLAAPASFVGIVAAAHVGIERTSPTDKLLLVDSITALAFAGCLWVLLQDRRPAGMRLYTRLAAWLAGCSFTLYVVHLPLLVFIRAWAIPDRPWSPSVANVSLGVLIAAAVLAVATGIAALTEAYTARVRRSLLNMLGARASTER